MYSNFKIRKAIAIVVALISAGYSMHSNAVTMGEIEIKSALGQPLLAEVKVTDYDQITEGACFAVAGDDPSNPFTVDYKSSNVRGVGVMIIRSRNPVVDPAISLTAFNRCQAPTKRNYTFIVQSQNLSASTNNRLDDKFHYDRAFNKLTQESELIRKQNDSPDRVYEGLELNSTAKLPSSPRPDSSKFDKDYDFSGYSLKDLAKRFGLLDDSPAEQTLASQDDDSFLSLRDLAAKMGLLESKPSNDNIYTDAESQYRPDPKTYSKNSSKKKSASTKTNKEKLSISKSDAKPSANGNKGKDDKAESAQLSDEMISMQNRLTELQAQVVDMSKINSNLEKLVQQVNLQLTQIKKENDFWRALAMSLGGILLISSYFFADWLRRKKQRTAYDHQPKSWSDLDSSSNAGLGAHDNFSFSNSMNGGGQGSNRANNIFGDSDTAPANKPKSTSTGGNMNVASSKQAPTAEKSAKQEEDPFDTIPVFKPAANFPEIPSVDQVTPPPGSTASNSKTQTENNNWFEFGEQLPPISAKPPQPVPLQNTVIPVTTKPQSVQTRVIQPQTSTVPVNKSPVFAMPPIPKPLVPQPAPIQTQAPAYQPNIQQIAQPHMNNAVPPYPAQPHMNNAVPPYPAQAHTYQAPQPPITSAPAQQARPSLQLDTPIPAAIKPQTHFPQPTPSLPVTNMQSIPTDYTTQQASAPVNQANVAQYPEIPTLAPRPAPAVKAEPLSISEQALSNPWESTPQEYSALTLDNVPSNSQPEFAPPPLSRGVPEPTPKAEPFPISEQALDSPWESTPQSQSALTLDNVPSNPQPEFAPPPVSSDASVPIAERFSAPNEQALSLDNPWPTEEFIADEVAQTPTHMHDWPPNPNENAATESEGQVAPKKEVVKVQPSGLMDDIDELLTGGRTNTAIQALKDHLIDYPKESAMIWLFLLDLLAKEGKRREYEVTVNECRKHFNIKIADFSVPLAPDDSIESYERVSAALQDEWGTPFILNFIDELVFNTRMVPRTGFERSIFEELIFLRTVAEELLSIAQIEPVSKGINTPDLPVSDEFVKLTEGIGLPRFDEPEVAQNASKDGDENYPSIFEFDLDELNKP